MHSIRRLPELWRSTKVNEVAVLEVTSYLLVPWLIVLPWSILQQWIVYQVISGSGHGIVASGLGGLSWQLTYAVLWYVLSFAPNLLIGFIYARRTRAVTLRRALVLGHLMIAWNYIGYVAAWRAVARLIRGRTDWNKTTRSSEAAEAPTVPARSPERASYRRTVSGSGAAEPAGRHRGVERQQREGLRPLRGQHRLPPQRSSLPPGRDARVDA